MIWFACKQCGKRHGRAENLSGTLVFCECGHGNRVPWTSTAAEPEDMPDAVPVPVPVPERPRPSIPLPPNERREPEFPRPRRAREFRRINPNFCLNHDETAAEATCDDCRLRFCPACVVKMQDRTLCGPCKNFRVRGLNRPGRVGALAIIGLVVSLVAGPVTFFLTIMGIGMHAMPEGSAAGAIFVCLIAAALPLAGLVLSALAMREIETRPNRGGRALAATGMAASLAGVIWSLALVVVIAAKQV